VRTFNLLFRFERQTLLRKIIMARIITFLSALAAAVAAAPSATPIRYMPMGDSITEIICWRGYLYQALQQANYTDVKFVGSNNDENPSGCPIENYDKHNEGHSGYWAINIANQNQLVGWLKQNPADVITVHLGTNDITNHQSTSSILAAFTTLVGQMRAANPAMKIIVSIPLPNSSPFTWLC
jgi:lysophospholipase L1-like esterase